MAFFDKRRHNSAEQVIETPREGATKSYSIAKVFGYMCMWLAITAVIALSLSPLLKYVLTASEGVDDSVFIALIVLLVASVITVLVLTFVIQIKFLRKGKSILVPGIIYSIAMGVLCSSVVMFVDWYLLGITFAITAALFGIMALIGLTAKKELNGLAVAGLGFFIGGILMSGFMLIVMFFFPTYYEHYYWIISLAILCGVVLTTIYDISRIKVLAHNGELNNNLSLFLSFHLYCDFMYILIRILELVLRASGNSSSK
jgi:FtsH-binding integral membrane protein